MTANFKVVCMGKPLAVSLRRFKKKREQITSPCEKRHRYHESRGERHRRMLRRSKQRRAAAAAREAVKMF